MTLPVFSDEWRHDVRALTDEEYLRDPKPCRIEGCDEAGLFEVSWFYRARAAGGRPWQRRERVCAAEAEVFAALHRLEIRAAS